MDFNDELESYISDDDYGKGYEMNLWVNQNLPFACGISQGLREKGMPPEEYQQDPENFCSSKHWYTQGFKIGRRMRDALGEDEVTTKALIERQRALIEALEEEKRQEAEQEAILARSRAQKGLVVLPMHQRVYRWSGRHLTPVGPRYLYGLGEAEKPPQKKEEDLTLMEIIKRAWDMTWGSVFSKETRERLEKEREEAHRAVGIGQAPTVLDPWGMPTTHLPIQVRREIEWEEELRRIQCEEAPFSRECEGYFGGGIGIAYIWRVDNLITGCPRYAHYAIPYKDKFGATHLAIGKKHPHLAVDELKRHIKQGRVNRLIRNFDEERFGYDSKLFITEQHI